MEPDADTLFKARVALQLFLLHLARVMRADAKHGRAQAGIAEAAARRLDPGR